MKALLSVIALVIAGLWLFSILSRNKRFKPPSDYDYNVSEAVDLDYHDPALLEDYLEGSNELGAYARRQWRNEKIDVLFPNEKKNEAMEAASRYQDMLSDVKAMEMRLIRSSELKTKGWSNESIAAMESYGMDPAQLTMAKRLSSVARIPLSRGDRGQLVLEFQKLLSGKGFDLKLDGFFDIETETTVKAFQEAQGLMPSGQIDAWVLEKLAPEWAAAAGS